MVSGTFARFRPASLGRQRVAGDLVERVRAGRAALMAQTYTAVIEQSGPWWIGWIEEVPGVNCQERNPSGTARDPSGHAARGPGAEPSRGARCRRRDLKVPDTLFPRVTSPVLECKT
jgi:hypothetical protein